MHQEERRSPWLLHWFFEYSSVLVAVDASAVPVRAKLGAGDGAVAGAGSIAICCLAFYTMVTRLDCCLVDCV